MSDMNFTTVDRILARVYKYIKSTDIAESDVIEWAGQALDLLKTPEIQEEAVKFLKVKNHEAELPNGFQMVLQIAKYNKDEDDIKKDCTKEVDVSEVDLECPDCCGECGLIDYLYCDWSCTYRPFFDMQWQYIDWTVSTYYKEYFTPVRLANHTLFNTIVCKEKVMYEADCCGPDEYTIVGTTEKKLRFSFKEGNVALSYIRSAVDKETGYPLVPDHEQHLSAINYFILWKIAELLDWNGREGYGSKAEKNMQLWLKYAKQAKNFAKMPKSIDQFQNLLEQSHYLIPRTNRYYGYFGSLGKAENRRFNDPDRRNKTYNRWSR